VPQIQGCENKLENSNKKSEFRVQQIKIPLKKKICKEELKKPMWLHKGLLKKSELNK